MKKYLAIVLAALLLVCSFASCANGSDGSIGDYAPEVDYLITETGTFYFDEGEGETAILVNYVGKATSGDRVVVPSAFNDRVVTEIGDRAFYNLSAIVEIVIPDTIQIIGDYAFARCTELTEVTLPDSVLEIGEGAFIECSALETVKLSSALVSIGDKAFNNCAALTQIDLPTDLESIGSGAFAFCKSLTALEFPAYLKTIGEMAYTDCVGVETITFASGKTDIAFGAFEHADGTNLKDKFVTEGLAEDSAVLAYYDSLSDSPETEPVAEEVADAE